MTIRKAAALIMALVMVFSLSTSASAATLPESGWVYGGKMSTEGNENVKTNISFVSEPTIFSVTVPTTIVVEKTRDGQITVPSNLAIVNNSYGPVEVSGIEIIPQSGWGVVDKDASMNVFKVTDKRFSLGINDDWISADTCADFISEQNWPAIPGHASMPLDLNVDISTIASALNNAEICTIVITVRWITASENGVVNNYNPAGGHLDNSKWHGNGCVDIVSGEVIDYDEINRTPFRLLISDTAPTNYMFSWDASQSGYEGEVIGYAAPVDLNNSTGIEWEPMKSYLEAMLTEPEEQEYFQTTFVDIILVTSNGYVTLSPDASGMFETTNLFHADTRYFDTSLVEDMSYMFYNAQWQSVFPSLEGWDTSNVQTMEGMFTGARFFIQDDDDAYRALEELDVSEVIYFNSMFEECIISVLTNNFTEKTRAYSAITNYEDWYDMDLLSYLDAEEEITEPLPLDLSRWDTGSAEDMEGMFCSCISFTLEGLDDWDVSNVENMEYMFEDTDISNIDISNWDVSNVRSMYSMFKGTYSDSETLDLSGWVTNEAINMAGMFIYTQFANIRLDNFVSTSVENIEKMFSYCPNLTYINLDAWTPVSPDIFDDDIDVFQQSDNIDEEMYLPKLVAV